MTELKQSDIFCFDKDLPQDTKASCTWTEKMLLLGESYNFFYAHEHSGMVFNVTMHMQVFVGICVQCSVAQKMERLI